MIRKSKWVMCVAVAAIGAAYVHAQGVPGQADVAVEKRVETAKEGIADSANAASCAAECLQCANTCLGMIEYCKGQGNAYAGAMQASEDCYQLCKLTGETEERAHQLHMALLPACIKACELCIAACEEHPEDEYCTECIRECRECMNACELHLKGAGNAEKAAKNKQQQKDGQAGQKSKQQSEAE